MYNYAYKIAFAISYCTLEKQSTIVKRCKQRLFKRHADFGGLHWHDYMYKEFHPGKKNQSPGNTKRKKDPPPKKKKENP